MTFDYDINKSYSWNENKMKKMFKAECTRNNLLRATNTKLLAEHKNKTSKSIRHKEKLAGVENSFTMNNVDCEKKAEEDIFFKVDEQKGLANKKTVEFLFVKNNYLGNDVASLPVVTENINFLEYPEKMTAGSLYYSIIKAVGKTPSIKNFLLNEEIIEGLYSKQTHNRKLRQNDFLEVYRDDKFSKSCLSKF